MEYDNGGKGILKVNKMAIIIGVVIIGLAVIVGVIVMLNVNPAFKTSNNDEALLAQSNGERAKIADVFNKRFQFLDGRYRIEDIVLMNEGEYAVVLLELNSASYRSILRKDGDEWGLIGVPAVVLYYEDFQDVPKDVVRAANDLGSGEGE